jgi:4-amino-4-deoxy-L-arabinose transferase-like glycosyltransferase
MTAAQDAREGRPVRALVVVAFASVAVASCIAANISTTIPFDSDEANHANIALRQYQDLRGGHLMDFVRHSYRTGQFPFLHGWMQLPAFFLLGATRFAARVPQCALFVLGALATAWTAYRASGGSPRAAAFAGVLFAASPALAAYAGLCMLETPGAAMTAVSLALFAEAVRARGRRATVLHLLTGSAVLGTYFTKLNFGLWIAPAVLAGYVAWWWKADDRKAAFHGGVTYLAVLVVVAVVWYSRAEQRAAFLGFLHNPSQLVPVERDDPSFRIPGLSWANLSEYFGLIAADFHVHWLLGAPVLLLFGWALRPRALLFSRPVLAASAACVLWTWLVLSMEFRQYSLARFIATALPPLWALAAVSADELLRRAPRRVAGTGAGLVLGVAVIVAQLALVPGRVEREYEVDDRFAPVFAFVVENVGAPASVACVNYTDHVSARTFVWELGTRPGRTVRDFDVKAFIAERVFESPKRLQDWMTIERRWGGADWESYVVEFEPGPAFLDSPKIVPETVALWADTLRSYGDRLENVAERRFEELDLTVVVWRDREPPAHVGLAPR